MNLKNKIEEYEHDVIHTIKNEMFLEDNGVNKVLYYDEERDWFYVTNYSNYLKISEQSNIYFIITSMYYLYYNNSRKNPKDVYEYIR